MKRIFSILLVLLLLVSCGSKKELSGKQYIELLENFEVKDRNKNNSKDNEEFEEFLEDIFLDALDNDYLTTHYMVSDLSKYNIEKPELTIGEIEYTTTPDNKELLEDYNRLLEFDYDSLSYNQQADYECLRYSILESLAYSYYAHYDFLFNGGNDLLSTLVTNFEEFVFYSNEDIDDYLVLLKDIDRYLDDALKYTSEQAKDGLIMADVSIDYSCDYVDDFVSKLGDNVLITSFNNKIDGMDLTTTQKLAYKENNKQIVIDEVIPAYKKVKEELETYRGKANTLDNRLCNIDKDYAKISFMINTSNNDDPKDMYNNALEDFEDMTYELYSLARNDEAIDEYLEVVNDDRTPFNLSLEEILIFLEENYTKDHPDVGDIDYDLSYLDASSAPDSIVAYYLNPPIDLINQNVIRVNPNSDTSGASAYLTLAHEGIPGHLYQNIYNLKHGLKDYHYVQSFIGYVEGYACFEQIQALNYTDLSEDAKTILAYDEISGYIFESIVDLGVNYMNWSMKDVEDFMDDCGYDSDYAETIVEDVIDRPCILVRYGIGYLNFRDLYNTYKLYLYDEVFNEVILENGEVPIPIVKKALETYE